LEYLDISNNQFAQFPEMILVAKELTYLNCSQKNGKKFKNLPEEIYFLAKLEVKL